ncbi:MAG: TPM domain-containing protein [Proteobacteria bacterium]|nr:TPM domain-containing protein [Pseudomonadota bacterium]HQR03108.1 TPM domain-containing protein [Rhodocyclaceae bacterium]
MARFWAACTLLLLFWIPRPGYPEALVSIPPLTARVTDLTGTLTPDQKASLEAASAGIEAEKGAQVGVLLLPTTRPEAIEQFGIRLAEAWKLGRKGVDDGAIVIVAKDDRRMRIEVGYGLEGAIPDVVAKRIVSDTMAPHFKQGDFYGGLEAAMQALAARIGAETLPPPAEPPGMQGRNESGMGGNIFMIGIVIAMLVGPMLRRALGNLLGTSLMAGAGGLVGWLVAGTGLGVIVAVITTIIVTVLGLDILLALLSGGGGGRGGSGGGFSGGGGGFSGGGGGFGGGGASGSW